MTFSVNNNYRICFTIHMGQVNQMTDWKRKRYVYFKHFNETKNEKKNNISQEKNQQRTRRNDK